jgi:hypothetical protein
MLLIMLTVLVFWTPALLVPARLSLTAQPGKQPLQPVNWL